MAFFCRPPAAFQQIRVVSAMRRRLTDAERALWHRVTAKIAPIKRTHTQPPVTPRLDRVESKQIEAPHEITSNDLKANAVTKQNHIDKKTAQRLKRGKFPIDGKIDLHGMTQKQAYGALLRFIEFSRINGRRMVIVVTGKGWNPDAAGSEQAVGVLRRMVPRWLESPPFTQHVAGITDASLKHGGSGALYVLLRKKKIAK